MQSNPHIKSTVILCPICSVILTTSFGDYEIITS